MFAVVDTDDAAARSQPSMRGTGASRTRWSSCCIPTATASCRTRSATTSACVTHNRHRQRRSLARGRRRRPRRPSAARAAAGSRGPCPRSARTWRRGSARPCAARRSGSISVSLSPCITSVGASTPRRSSAREPDGADRDELTAYPPGRSCGRTRRSASSRQRSSSANSGLPQIRIPSMHALRWPTPGRWRRRGQQRPRLRGRLAVLGLAGTATSPTSSSAAGRGGGSPVVCTIIPPIDRPMTCAALDADRVEHGDRVGGHVGERVGRALSSTGASVKCVDRPTSRLSKRITWKPAATNISHHSDL